VDFLLQTDNLMLVGIAASSGLMLLWPIIQRARAGGSVSAVQAVQLINHEDAVIVDVRPLATFQNGHIAHSQNIPLAELEQKLAKLPKDKPILVTCDRGQISVSGAARLRKAGFERVAVIEGGLNAWLQAGLPISTKKK
jgi:rhodanese-related sulfurtransferase